MTAYEADRQYDLCTCFYDAVNYLTDLREFGAFARCAFNALNPGGTLLVTVPALKSLWSAHDVRNHHCRRYDRSMLLAFVGAARELIAAHLLNHEAQSLTELEDPIVTVAERLLLGR